MAACLGATWIGGGVVGTIGLLAESLRTGGIILVGEPLDADNAKFGRMGTRLT